MNNRQLELFGTQDNGDKTTLEKYGAYPFTVLDSRESYWKERKKWWNNKGILPPILPIRSKSMTNMPDDAFTKKVSSFDPFLCELMYRWFCPVGGSILDPFAGGSVRGIVAGSMGYSYTGIDIRESQVESNIEQASKIIDNGVMPKWVAGDSAVVLKDVEKESYDMLFTCPPYGKLEIYTYNEGDLSNMSWRGFRDAYKDIIKKSCLCLKSGAIAVIVVGEVRGYNHFYRGLVPYTIRCFLECGMEYFNEAILVTPYTSAFVRVEESMKRKKLVKVHQNLLMFYKPERENKRKYSKKVYI